MKKVVLTSALNLSKETVAKLTEKQPKGGDKKICTTPTDHCCGWSGDLF